MNCDHSLWTPERIFQPRPGGKPVISPEGLVYCTDGKCRWVGQAAPTRTGLLAKLLPPPRCILYILDRDAVSAQRVKGKVGRDRVFALISQWTGGQSYPSLHFDPPIQRKLAYVTEAQSLPDRGCIRLDGGQGKLDLYGDPAQLDAVHALLLHVQQATQQA